MSDPDVSIIVVSRGRPDALRRCLLGISQLFYHPFEVVVVADPAGCAAVAGHAGHIKIIAFDDANISAARNAGLDHAAGQIVAFIDDDAVPEPSWLDHLIAPFSDPDVSASGGWVRGRNGISFQNQSRWVDGNGAHVPVEHLGPDPMVLRGSAGFAPRTEGTNMAWRRSALADLCGFNTAYRFFLDETDLNMRLGRNGGMTALVPLAQVHHSYAASPRRRPDRVPRDLFDIGASWSVYLKRFSEDPDRSLQVARQAERARMVRYAVRGDVWPSEVKKRLAEFDAGTKDGASRSDAFWRPGTPPAFKAFHQSARVRSSVAIVSGLRRRKDARDRALAEVDTGTRVSLLRLSPTALFHHVRFNEAGIWLHTGGIWGRSTRDMPLVSRWTRRSRAHHEVAKVSELREISATHFIDA